MTTIVKPAPLLPAQDNGPGTLELPQMDERAGPWVRVRRSGRTGILRALAAVGGLGILGAVAIFHDAIGHTISAVFWAGVIAGAVITAVALAVLALWTRHLVKTHGAVRVIGRFFGGLHLDGRPRTDAGVFRRGARVLHPSGHATRWAHLRHVERAGIRLGAVVVILAALFGLAEDTLVTVVILIIVAGAGLGFGTWWTHHQVRVLAHVRKYVKPLHVALAPQIGHPLAMRPKNWITIPRDFATTEGAQIQLKLPQGFLGTKEAKQLVMTGLSDKLAIEDGSLTFHTVGPEPYALITTSTPPPDKVTFASARTAIEAAPESAPLIGFGRARSEVSASWEDDSPHLLMSAGSGGGKSALIRCVFAQGLHHGALGIVLDLKRMSQAWARGLPNVVYCRSIVEVHNMLIALGAEVERRNERADDLADEDGNIPDEAFAEIGPRIEIVCEEMNATTGKLQNYWRRIKDKDDPAVSPAVEALNDILFMGRATRVNCLAVAQMMTARALGGPEARENFATRILARHTMNAWRMLVPEVWPMPKSSRHLGRVQVVNAGVARETQVVFFAPKEAREWALSGTVAHITESPLGGSQATLVQARATDRLESGHQGKQPVSATTTVALVGAPGDARVGLGEACDGGVLSVGLAAVRSARARDPEFPRPIGKRGKEMLYSADALAAWERNRPMAKEDDAS